MAQYGRYLRVGDGSYYHWCPGCSMLHRIPVTASQGPNWKFNGDKDTPDFKPSVRITHNGDPEYLREAGIAACCHYFIDNGNLNYCADSTHDFAGKSIPLPELPIAYRDEIEESTDEEVHNTD